MALVKCPECTRDVSETAEVCPQCGFKLKVSVPAPPRAEKNNGSSGCLWLIGLTWLFFMIITWTSDPESNAPEVDEASTQVCKADLDCMKRTIRSGAIVDCANAIEKSAKWDYEWPDGSGYKAFPTFIWSNPEHTEVVLSGRSLKLQNGFGGWKHVSYICTVNVNTRNVTGVQIIE